MIALMLALVGTAAAAECDAVDDVSGTIQVAWVSRVGRTVGPHTTIEVVRVSELRSWIRDQQADPLRLAKGLGMVRRNASPGGRADGRDYKVVLFDVETQWLCRPIEDGEPGEQLGGVPVCAASDQGPIRHHRQGYTGCGYSLDTASSTRGVDVYRISWADATAQGFCMFPLQRFIDGA